MANKLGGFLQKWLLPLVSHFVRTNSNENNKNNINDKAQTLISTDACLFCHLWWRNVAWDAKSDIHSIWSAGFYWRNGMCARLIIFCPVPILQGQSRLCFELACNMVSLGFEGN